MPVTAVVYTLSNPKQTTRSFEEIKREAERKREREREIDVRWPGFRKDQEQLQKLSRELEEAEKAGDSARVQRLKDAIQQLEHKWRYK
jgi:hypothetical protein